MTTDDDFMKFMEDEYKVKFVDSGKKQKDNELTEDSSVSSKEPPPLPQAWVGLYSLHKRDAMYYEKCLRDIRDGIIKVLKRQPDDIRLSILGDNISNVLSAEYELDGVDLDKPNYGMF